MARFCDVVAFCLLLLCLSDGFVVPNSGRTSVMPLKHGNFYEEGIDTSNIRSFVPAPDTMFKPPPGPIPLDFIGRESRLREIYLLKSLKRNDNRQPELLALWFNERGPKAAQFLRHAQKLIRDGQFYAAENLLKDLIKQHGVQWVAPINILAALYLEQKRLHESKELCEVVLKVKPWHIDAQAGIVSVCEDLRDVRDAQKWAARRLPDVKHIKQRFRWVEQALKNAHAQLKDAEKLEEAEDHPQKPDGLITEPPEVMWSGSVVRRPGAFE
mmetsp:Transcript_370/g.892  ORF Transcript_370/g.892 Transcript_370/m.892 type:complete len:270 (-) Transcript_370:138-947(-)|eukprot:CAMPEP_0116830990 /NCGR_PEP_ID=MMETSP0418-20121206/5080_1 /TAXON_ID=1158023 /ORGANISM="Astrosyne radiata, Strain 13vi08-1A" /LENGTH=269 /DNA_ID=CAMNT_0004460175 /DNA_START=1271 /DNA_END=2080 /DNA_ORIENTATION=-